MVEGSWAQQAKTMATLKETVAQHATMLTDILHQLGSLAASYAELSKQSNPKPTENQHKEQGESRGENAGSNNPFSEEGIQARALKLDFTKFNGTDPIDWIQKAQQFFNYGTVHDNQKVPIIAFHMQGKTLTWYN